jgi:hypothetical protein
MRWILLLLTLPGTRDLASIDSLNECVQLRFQTTAPTLGMSRIMVPNSMGRHFSPRFNMTRDFLPENDREREVIAKLESESVQVGFYLFGRAILEGDATGLNPRTLKGPGAMTAGTPRAAWYPGLAAPAAGGDALPDWKTVYPLAQRAMKSFADGGSGFEATIDSWRIAARPVAASQEKCVGCHQGVTLRQPVGGVLYAYRRRVAVMTATGGDILLRPDRPRAAPTGRIPCPSPDPTVRA